MTRSRAGEIAVFSMVFASFFWGAIAADSRAKGMVGTFIAGMLLVVVIVMVWSVPDRGDK